LSEDEQPKERAVGREGFPARMPDALPSPHRPSAIVTRPGLDERGTVFFAAIEMIRMPMILTDPRRPDNPIIFANQAFQDLTGYEEADLIGRNCRFLQGPQTDRGTVDELRDAVAAQRAIATEILNYKRDGTPFWNSVFIGPVFDDAGDILYFFASQLDITRRWASEQAFRQAQKMDAIGQLTAGLAHDFNNLLQVVTGNLEMAVQSVGEERPARQIARAIKAAERGAKLTTQLLAFARRTRLEPKVLGLNALVLAFAEVIESTLGDAIAVKLDLTPGLPGVTLDRTHLEVALLNVLLNARDAMPKGGTVTIATDRVTVAGDVVAQGLPPGEYVALRVTDEGEGMPPHVIERATEPFFSTKGAARGTGLGLAMVHGFVQQSLGRLEIASREGHGTTVSMIFPATAAEEAPAESRHRPRRGSETVLVVEDGDDVRSLASEYLEDLGYTVLLARDGQEALAVIEAEPALDLVFSDLVMPGGLDGLGLAAEARRRRPDLPVLLVTDDEPRVADGPRAPTMDVLGKPYRKSELADRVRAAIDRGAGQRVAPGEPPHG
jgi:PAS domain S-box-containing protein